ncbi:DNA recombination protein RmuC [Desulfomicrobium macestii]|uniref:DNA recombination protein RmuC n=1 Tax=Desulfomicrobium macestii TaxID=90731 RepID=A0ABR9H9K3_9BACT|nr:DNA recombination protein RmuC [Desulfomicrobium macestii]MBE1427228.1 DNA recombination protein RmuC [Desulfomicrobium macestii]
MHEILLYAPIALPALTILLLLAIMLRTSKNTLLLGARLEAVEKSMERTERILHDEITRNRDETGRLLLEQRREVIAAFKELGGGLMHRVSDAGCAQARQLDTLAQNFASFAASNLTQLDSLGQQASANSKALREEILATLNGISETSTRTVGDLGQTQKKQLDAMVAAIASLSETNAAKLETVRSTVETKLHMLQTDNARQLETMRQTVDEKLQGTLEKRLGESFKQVSERLEQVHKGLGEMQSLATGVGDLKKVLTNVKTRGTWGEVQLGALLEQVLSAEQYAKNVATKGGAERVEFAIRLPGQDSEAPVLLPIDAKFPIEDYQRLLEAQERGDVEALETAGKQLEIRVKACARDIRDKYVSPPHTTDFGILFLPIEGLFAEVIRRPGLSESIQRDFRIVIAGPTTLWSILNSLQMGFRTLAIQKRSSEVWNLLGAVKTEWGKYGEILDAVQKKIHQASETIEKAKVRTRVIGRKLQSVQEMPIADSAVLLSLPVEIEEEDEEVSATTN